MKKLMIVILFMLIVWNVNAFDIRFPDFSPLFKTKLSLVHFYSGPEANPQNSWWLMMFNWLEVLDKPEELGFSISSMPGSLPINYGIKCNAKLKWYYVNLVRWNYILPLDESDSYDSNIWVNGWFYTNCNIWDYNDVYGFIEYTYNRRHWFNLYVGFKYDIKDNKPLFTKWFNSTFKLYNGIKPVWFIYDELWWVGFVWWKVPSLNWVKNIMNKGMNISYVDWKLEVNRDKIDDEWVWAVIKSMIWIRWAYNLSESNFKTEWEKKFIIKWIWVKDVWVWYKKTAYIAWEWMVNLSYILNKARRNAIKMCRWRWKKISWTKRYDGITDNLEKINCFEWNGRVSIEYDPTDEHTIVVTRWWVDVLFKTSMEWKKYMEVFIDKWKLLIDNDINLKEINSKWEVWDGNIVTSWAVLKWIFMVNGLIWWEKNGVYVGFNHKLYVQWMVASLNTISVPKESRIEYVKKVLWEEFWKEKYVNLQKIFSWRCKNSWIWTDGVNCSNEKDKWWENPIIFIKKQYSSELLRN